MLLPGDPAPNFSAPSSVNPAFHFDTAAGRYVALCFFASSRLEFAARVPEEVSGRADRFNVTDAVFFGVSVDPADRARLTQSLPGIVYFFDDDLSVRRRVRGEAVVVPGVLPSTVQGSDRRRRRVLLLPPARGDPGHARPAICVRAQPALPGGRTAGSGRRGPRPGRGVVRL